MSYQGDERRKYARGNLPIKMFVHLPSGKLISVFLSDVSLGGVKLKVPEKLKVDQIIAVELCTEDHPEHINARVAWVHEERTGGKTKKNIYFVGLDFDK
ncbi:MAG: PilZ domain-containing protein [Candidatus Omnitrophica bacterium]|nr:PilZ domain-containing protein [Candidatus Omnitrophota bacterium]MDD5081566.1 PilZ domain-containing protein [Candidatus Omnitrophota bacterium]MDD5440871.1 PilZ domain-containing protein [Candidatus Omnitrophota bacterium]